jgi:hypothetical protein
MIEKSFRDARGREVIIKVNDECILFYHGDVVKMQKRWVEEQEENGYEVSDDEKEVDEFYWIEKDRWIKDFKRLDDESAFHTHMKRKTWFTNEMYNFMNKSCGI